MANITKIVASLDDGTTQTFLPAPTGPTDPPPQPTTLIKGVQGAWLYPGAYSAGVAFPQQGNVNRKALQSQMGVTAIRIWATIPNNAVVGGSGDNQADTIKLIQQAYAEGLAMIPTWTPNTNQPYSTPFLPQAPLVNWETQWLNAAEAATGVKAALLFPFGIECGNEICNFSSFWAGKQTEIPSFVMTSAGVLHGRGIKCISPAWNGTTGASSLSNLQAAYGPFLSSVDTIGLHPYSITPGQWSQQVYAWASRPIVMTEFNAVTQNGGTIAGDADKLQLAMNDLRANGRNVQAIVHWPSVVTPSIPGGMNGLVDQNGNPVAAQVAAFST